MDCSDDNNIHNIKMGLFNKSDDMDFDAYETDKSQMVKMIIIIFIAIGAVIGIIYGAFYYVNLPEKVPATNSTGLIKNGTTLGKVIVDFEGTNVTVDENPIGIYYYHTEDVISEEICTANNQKINCLMLTESYCENRICRKEIKTETRCYVNQKRVDCPEGL